jgi:hypothetical protein
MSATRAYRPPLRKSDPSRLSTFLPIEVEAEAKRLGLTPSALMRRVWRAARPAMRKTRPESA